MMITLIPLTDNYTIYQIEGSQKIPTPIFDSEFYSITKTNEEISIVTNCKTNFDNLKSEKNWLGFKVNGVLDFSSIGIINDITKPLKDNKISVFVISTFNTDFIFVKKESFQKSIEIFEKMNNIKIKYH